MPSCSPVPTLPESQRADYRLKQNDSGNRVSAHVALLLCREELLREKVRSVDRLLGGVANYRTELGAARNLGRDERRGRMA